MPAPGELAADWTMMMVVNAELSELQILPTHRILLDADLDALRVLAAGDDPLFTSIPLAPDALAAALQERGSAAAPAFGLLLPGGEGYLLVGDPDRLAERLRSRTDERSGAWTGPRGAPRGRAGGSARDLGRRSRRRQAPRLH